MKKTSYGKQPSFDACAFPLTPAMFQRKKFNSLDMGNACYLPYSSSRTEKRQDLFSILEATHRLPTSDSRGRTYENSRDRHLQNLETRPRRIYLCAACPFLEESMPFIRLIGNIVKLVTSYKKFGLFSTDSKQKSRSEK
jgi:hypothetical protein